MSIMIKDMELPNDGVEWDCFVKITSDAVEFYDPTGESESVFYKAVELPPHGDLIDRDALPWENQGFMLTDPDEWGLKVWDIEHAPTIIPAEEVQE